MKKHRVSAYIGQTAVIQEVTKTGYVIHLKRIGSLGPPVEIWELREKDLELVAPREQASLEL